MRRLYVFSVTYGLATTVTQGAQYPPLLKDAWVAQADFTALALPDPVIPSGVAM